MNRVSFLGSAIAFAAADPPGGTTMVEARAAFDENTFSSAVGRQAQIRQMWENVALKPTVFANIKNALNGLQFGYAYAPSAIAMAVVNHGPSAAYTYGDAIWSKYRIADFVAYKPDDVTGPINKNLFWPRKNAADGPSDPDNENSPYQDTSIQALQARGVVFLTCHTAVMEQSRALVKRGYAPAGMKDTDVAADILTHLVPGAIVVPSGVATVAVLAQRYNYAYTTIQS